MIPKHFMEAIRDDPKDWDLRRVVADWCEENGDMSIADCLRWMANNQKRAIKTDTGFKWYNVSLLDETMLTVDSKSDLEDWLFSFLPGVMKEYENGKEYKTREESELAIYQAWALSRVEVVP